MFMLCTSEGDLLMRAIDLLRDVTDSISPLIFDFFPQELWIAAVDLYEIAHAAVIFRPFLVRDDRSFFQCNRAGLFCIDSMSVEDYLHFEEGDDYSLAIQDNAYEDPLLQIFFGTGDPFSNLLERRSNVPRCVVLGKQPLFRREAAIMRNLQHHRFRVLVGLHQHDFRRIFGSGSASVTITHERVEFSAREFCWVFPKGVRMRQCIIGGVGEAEEDRVEFRIRISSPRTVVPAACLSDRVWILHSNGTPTMICYPMLEIGGFLKFFFVGEPS